MNTASLPPSAGGAPAPLAVIVVGDEILSGYTLDTNSHHLVARADAAGHPARWVLTIGDDPAQIAAAVAGAVADATLTRIVVCGGIGPTPDDRTVEGVTMGLGRDLEENPAALAAVAARVRLLHEAGRLPDAGISAANRRMTRAPAGADVLDNSEGMAPGLAIRLDDDDRRWLFVLPGVPREFLAIVDEQLIPRHFGGGRPAHVAEVRYSGIPEAVLATPMTQLAEEFPDVVVGSYPQRLRREVVLRLRGLDAERVDAAALRLRELQPPQDGPTDDR